MFRQQTTLIADYTRETHRLVELTAQYTAETRRLAELTAQAGETAKGQLAEVVSSRLAAVQPYVHVAGVDFSGPAAEHEGHMFLQVQVTNLGAGPALGVRAYVAHLSRQVDVLLEPVDLEAHGRGILSIRTRWQPKLAQVVEPDGVLWLEYHDMADRRWWTRMPLKIDRRTTDGYSRLRHSRRPPGRGG